ncbi:hypothetical protein [Paludibaculum fermentans]|uniref:hypothetical protein n=1 Tax=Paludibaculum fermentans TaxID=1473598 RepID=UPI003EBBD11B
MWQKIWKLFQRDVSVVEAGPTSSRRSIHLTPTRSGRGLSAAGKVKTFEDAGWRYLHLAVRIDLHDGTPLAVLVNHEAVGSILVSGCEAELEIGVSESESALHSLLAMRGIKTGMVATLDGTAVLTGAFPTLAQRAAANTCETAS